MLHEKASPPLTDFDRGLPRSLSVLVALWRLTCQQPARRLSLVLRGEVVSILVAPVIGMALEATGSQCFLWHLALHDSVVFTVDVPSPWPGRLHGDVFPSRKNGALRVFGGTIASSPQGDPCSLWGWVLCRRFGVSCAGPVK